MSESLFLFEESADSTAADELTDSILKGYWNQNVESARFTDFVKNGNDLSKNEKLLYAVSCLLTYVEENFVVSISRAENELKNFAELNIDGIEINANFKNVEYLQIARQVLGDLIKKYPEDVIVHVWYMRMLKVLQNSLDENSMSLYEEFLKIHEILSRKKLEDIENVRFRFIVQLEIISIYLMYRRSYKVEELLNELKDQYKISILEEGFLGVRTKWQQKALPQFHVSIVQDESDLFISPDKTHAKSNLLKLLELEDDTRLESIKYLDEKNNELQILSSMLQNFLLINIKHLQISQPNNKLTDEEIQPYVMLLLKQNNGPWQLRLEALLINIKNEANHRRTVDRSLRQCESIINYISSESNNLKSTEKVSLFSYVFSSLMTPHFKIKKLLADLMVSLGLIKGALDIYIQIGQWEDVISCYTRLQLRHKAAEIITKELEKKPSVKLYCLLGDATDDTKCYEDAWNFSQNRSGLAQKHWGMYYFGKNDYANAIPHLKKSLEINSLQENLWLRLGYSCLSVENYELAASSYLRYTQLEPNGFESWNNLAKCFIKMGNKRRAHKVLQEALKCNYDNWKIWENFLFVSIDIGSFEDAINAYNRLLEIKEKYFDEEVLRILVNAIAKDVDDNDGNSSLRLRKKTLEMLAHIGSIHMNEGVVWELSALITEEPVKKAEKLQKAYKGYVSKSPNWSNSEEMCRKLVQLSSDLCVFSLQATDQMKEHEKMLVLSQLSSARLTAQGCVKVANQYESCNDIVQNIDDCLQKILIKIKEMK